MSQENQVAIRDVVGTLVSSFEEIEQEMVNAVQEVRDAHQRLADVHSRMTSYANPDQNPYRLSGRYNGSWVTSILDSLYSSVDNEHIRKYVHAHFWSHAYSALGLREMMNQRQRYEYLKINTEGLPMFRENPDFEGTPYAMVPPVVSEDSVEQILSGLMSNARAMMLEGLAEAFSKLSPLFKSHDTFCMKSRIILDYMHGSDGYAKYRSVEQFFDIDRAARAVLGKIPPREETLAVIYGSLLEKAKCEGFPQVAEKGPWKVRIFKKGTVHVYMEDSFRRKLNKLLAEYYGYSLGHEREDHEEDLLEKDRETVDLGPTLDFFPTPKPVVDKMLDKAGLYRRKSFAYRTDEQWQKILDGRKHLKCLEPSAGAGGIAKFLAEESNHVDCYELDPERAASLRSQGIYQNVDCLDFLKVDPPLDPEFGYNIVLMNPPFGKKSAITHVYHAFKFLKQGGVLVSVMDAGTLYREDKYTNQFRKWVREQKGSFSDLPPRSFSPVGTNVNTILVRIQKG